MKLSYTHIYAQHTYTLRSTYKCVRFTESNGPTPTLLCVYTKIYVKYYAVNRSAVALLIIHYGIYRGRTWNHKIHKRSDRFVSVSFQNQKACSRAHTPENTQKHANIDAVAIGEKWIMHF